MLAWNKGKLGVVPAEQIEVVNGVRRFTVLAVGDAANDLQAMCLGPGTAPVVQSGTRGFVASPGSCATTAFQALAAESEAGNTVLANTQTSTPGSRWDIVVTNNREAVELLAQPSGAYAVLGGDPTHQQLPGPPPKKKKDNTAQIVVGGVVGGLLGLVAGGIVGAGLGGAAGAFAGSQIS